MALVIQSLNNSIFEIPKIADIQADFDSEEIKNKTKQNHGDTTIL